MSAYPPPPVPPAGGPVPPPYSPYDRRAIKAQQKALRRQARSMRRGSVVGPLLVLSLGVIFFLAQTGKLSWTSFFGWYSRWWPLVLIGAGALLMVEWALGRRTDADGTPRPRVVLGGGVIFLLILLAISGASSAFAFKMDLLARQGMGGLDFPSLMSAIGERHDEDTTVGSAIGVGNSLLVRVPRGDVNLTGTSDDGQVHVNAHKEVHSWGDSAAQERLQALQPVFRLQNGVLNLEVPANNGGRVDLTIQVPRTAAVTVNADHGDVTLGQLHAPVSVSARNGEINADGIAGTVSVHMGGAHTSFSGHSINGGVTLEGRSSEVNISDIVGPVSLEGVFYGTTHLEHVNGQVSFHSSRTKFDAARLDGELNFEGGQDLEAEALLGPVTLQTAYKNIRLDRVQGEIHVVNRDGAVTITHTAPMSPIEITNKGGSVDLGLPANAAFELQAETHDGDIETDYGLQSKGNGNEANKASGKVGGGGPLVRISTDNGDVTVRKSAVEPLPAIPAAPKVTMEPPAKIPAIPATPKIPAIPAVPAVKAPKAPKAPAAPATGKTSDWQ